MSGRRQGTDERGRVGRQQRNRKVGARGKAPLVGHVGLVFVWLHGTEATETTISHVCPSCGRAAVAPLPPGLLALQPDDTTHVCHPIYGGCNTGFALTGDGS